MASQTEDYALEKPRAAAHNGAQGEGGLFVKNVAWIVAPILLIAAAGWASADNSSGRRLYKWVDEKGMSHYGDRIPPEYANQEHEVFNSKGVQVDHLEAQKSAEQVAIEDQKKQAAEELKNRDKNLLIAYVSVQEIERLRDQRLALLADQMRVTSQFLDILNGRLRTLEKTTMTYRPYSTDPQAAQMPDQVAEDLVHMANDIRTQQQNLIEKQHEDATMRAQFESDISRFKELKGSH
jgi:hypothetical protein